jgi:cellulose synthase/poly-beta-1,6-N-acetylglucosamine synthase-like glycosyltransferase
VVLPCLDEERHIEACLRGALGQDYPADRMEIIVADGGSRDATRGIVRGIAEQDPRVTLVDNPGRLQSAGMNEAIKRARGEVIVRMDVHAEYAPDYVRKSVEVLERTGADNVGGAARTRSQAPFQRALCAALESPLGVGGSKYRDADNEGWVESVFNGAFRRNVFERVGLYDPRAVTNEDAELNQRIHDAGGRVYLSREVVVHYFPRDRAGALARQYLKYGQGRARTLLKHRRLLSIRPVIPFLMVAAGAVLLAVPRLHGLLAWALGAYAALALAEAVRVGRGGGARQVLTVWGIFPVLHVAHGVGFASGLVRYLRRPDWSEPELLPARAPAAEPVAEPAASAAMPGAAAARAAGTGA